MDDYYQDLQVTINSTSPLDTAALRSALDDFAESALEAKALEQQAVATNDTDLLTLVNHKYRDFQRGFVSQGGLPGREFYKHLIFAPGSDTGTF
jgi:N-acetylated-alpha-linked acidic dipeptidase